MSEKSQKERIGTGMGAWSKGLESSAPDLARQLNRPREAGWQALEDLDLPRYKRVVVPVVEFHVVQPEEDESLEVKFIDYNPVETR